MRCLATVLITAALCAGQAKVETGEINGAAFQIHVPDNWNRVLIVYCHGYTPTPGKFVNETPDPMVAAMLGLGFAVARSGYAGGGWAIEEAMQDTQALLRYFRAKYGAPKETYVTGHSMGGFLTMALIERFPDSYDGGLPLCGPLASPMWFMRRHLFDVRVVFDHYFPGALPAPDKVPRDYAMTPALNGKILELLNGKPAAAEALRRYTGIRTNLELAGTLVFFTYILKDLEQRGGGNPFDNRNIIYTGTGEDDAVNDGVKRYAADARAAEYLRTWYTATGHLERPMLAIHTTYDPIVPPDVPDMYATLAEQAGSADLFVQQYVKRPGHCSFQPQEIARGLEQLRAWKQQGQRPAAGPQPCGGN